VSENRVLREIFEPKRIKATGGRKETAYEELHSLYSSPNIIRTRRMKQAGHVARMAEIINSYIILVGNPEGERPLGRPKRRW
jgi:hypothetical protein